MSVDFVVNGFDVEYGFNVSSPAVLSSLMSFLIDDESKGVPHFVFLKDNDVRFVVELNSDLPNGIFEKNVWLDQCFDVVDSYFSSEGEHLDVVPFIFGDFGLVDRYEELVNSFKFEVLSRFDIDMVDAIVIDSDRWLSLLCYDLDCCPKNGTDIVKLFIDEEDVVVSDLKERFEFAYDPETIYKFVINPKIAKSFDARLEVVTPWIANKFKNIDVEDFIGAIHDPRVRDAVLHCVFDLSSDEQLDVMYTFMQLSRHVDGKSGASIATMVAGIAWANDMNDLALRALDYVSTIMPGYSLAVMLHGAINNGIDKSVWISTVIETSFADSLFGSSGI
jgi:hypothetical protein